MSVFGWVKTGLQTVATAAGCLPVPILGDAIELLCEGGAFVAGACDPTTSLKAEMAEAATRVAIAAIPVPGSSLAKIPATAALKYGMKEVGAIGAAGIGLGIDYSEGKLSEFTVPEYDKMLAEMYREQGIDFAKLSEAEKQNIRATHLADVTAAGGFVVDKDYRRLSAKDFGATVSVSGAALPDSSSSAPAPSSEPIYKSEIKALAEGEYRAQHGISEHAGLTAAQQQEVEAISRSATLTLLQSGMKVVDDGVLAEAERVGLALGNSRVRQAEEGNKRASELPQHTKYRTI